MKSQDIALKYYRENTLIRLLVEENVLTVVGFNPNKDIEVDLSLRNVFKIMWHTDAQDFSEHFIGDSSDLNGVCGFLKEIGYCVQIVDLVYERKMKARRERNNQLTLTKPLQLLYVDYTNGNRTEIRMKNFKYEWEPELVQKYFGVGLESFDYSPNYGLLLSIREENGYNVFTPAYDFRKELSSLGYKFDDKEVDVFIIDE